MSLWGWLKVKLIRRQTPAAPSAVVKEFDKMLEQERAAAEGEKREADKEHREVQIVRQRSWYLHGQFEKARTADAFSEWLFNEQPGSEQ